MYIAILGRQPALGMAELERLYGEDKTRWFSDQSACITADSFLIDHLGGTQKAARVTTTLPHADWRAASLKIVQTYAHTWANFEGKLTLGISAYGFDVTARDIQKTGILLKQRLKKTNVSVRLIPNTDPALSSATSHHNKLGLSNNKIELIIVRARDGHVIISESIGAQNITAFAIRDQGRPKRDAFVGMLPPKLAQIMINLALPLREERRDNRLSRSHPPKTSYSTPTLRSRPDGEKSLNKSFEGVVDSDGADSSTIALEVSSSSSSTIQDNLQPEYDRAPGPLFVSGAKPGEKGTRGGASTNEKNTTTPLRLLDPFCGTGVILQEAALMGYAVYGTDIADKMIDFTHTNLQWLARSHNITINATLHQGDAMDTKWNPPISAVVAESYLGQPFSAPPSPSKLDQVRHNCNHIISTFLQNIAPQLASGTPLCIAIPAWRSPDGRFTHLALIAQLDQFGFKHHVFKHINKSDLLYYREDQVVARELLVLVKS